MADNSIQKRLQEFEARWPEIYADLEVQKDPELLQRALKQFEANKDEPPTVAPSSFSKDEFSYSAPAKSPEAPAPRSRPTISAPGGGQRDFLSEDFDAKWPEIKAGIEAQPATRPAQEKPRPRTDFSLMGNLGKQMEGKVTSERPSLFERFANWISGEDGEEAPAPTVSDVPVMGAIDTAAAEGAQQPERSIKLLGDSGADATYKKDVNELNKWYGDAQKSLDKQELAETLAQALSLFGASLYGMKTGRDAVSNLKFKPRDWEAKRDRLLTEMQTHLSRLREERQATEQTRARKQKEIFDVETLNVQKERNKLMSDKAKATVGAKALADKEKRRNKGLDLINKMYQNDKMDPEVRAQQAMGILVRDVGIPKEQATKAVTDIGWIWDSAKDPADAMAGINEVVTGQDLETMLKIQAVAEANKITYEEAEAALRKAGKL